MSEEECRDPQLRDMLAEFCPEQCTCGGWGEDGVWGWVFSGFRKIRNGVITIWLDVLHDGSMIDDMNDVREGMNE